MAKTQRYEKRNKVENEKQTWVRKLEQEFKSDIPGVVQDSAKAYAI